MNRMYRRTSGEIIALANELHREIDAIEAMPEEDVCTLYNVDFREEVVNDIRHELKGLEEELEWVLVAEEEEDAWQRRILLAATPLKRAYASMGF
jgi:hypothetical protein